MLLSKLNIKTSILDAWRNFKLNCGFGCGGVFVGCFKGVAGQAY
jgi:hypothetical protein